MTLLHQEDQLFDLLKTRKSGAKVIAALALGKKSQTDTTITNSDY